MSEPSEIATAIIARVRNANGVLGGPMSDHEAAWLVMPMRDYVGGTDGILMHLMRQRERYAAARSNLTPRMAELEAALGKLSEQPTSRKGIIVTGAMSADWHAGYDAAISVARAARKGGA